MFLFNPLVMSSPNLIFDKVQGPTYNEINEPGTLKASRNDTRHYLTQHDWGNLPPASPFLK